MDFLKRIEGHSHQQLAQRTMYDELVTGRDKGAARDFYEALKGEHAGRKVDSVGGQIVPLVGYWWRDLATLAERSVSASSIGPA